MKHFWQKAYFKIINIFWSKFRKNIYVKVRINSCFFTRNCSFYFFVCFFCCCCVINTKITKFFFFLLEIFRFALIVLHTLYHQLYRLVIFGVAFKQLQTFRTTVTSSIKEKNQVWFKNAHIAVQYVTDNLPVSKTNFKLARWGSAGKVLYISWSFKIHGYHVTLNYLLWQLYAEQKKLELSKATKCFHLLIFNTACCLQAQQSPSLVTICIYCRYIEGKKIKMTQFHFKLS